MGTHQTFKFPPPHDASGGAPLVPITDEERRIAWEYVSQNLNELAQKESGVGLWFYADGASMLDKPADIFDYFEVQHGGTMYYHSCQAKINNMRSKFIGGGTGKSGEAVPNFDFWSAGQNTIGAAKFPESEEGFTYSGVGMLDVDLRQLFGGGTALTYAKTQWKDIKACLIDANARWLEGAPPAGSAPIGEGDFNASMVEAAARATKRAKDLLKGLASAAPTIKPAPKANSLGFREQCFLLAKVVDLAEHKMEHLDVTTAKAIPYDPVYKTPWNASIMCMGEPFSFLNRLAVYPDQDTFLEMKTEEIANLQPQIQFYKISQDASTKQEVTTPIHFETSTTKKEMDTLFEAKKKRGAGTGIEKFDVKLIGQSSFAAKKDLEATLTIFATSLSDLLIERTAHATRADGTLTKGVYRYVDLALKTLPVDRSAITENLSSKTARQLIGNLKSLSFTIRAVIGMRSPFHMVQNNTSLRAAISHNFMTLEMTPIRHEFNFEQDGSLRFVIHYQPFINEHFNGLAYDIFNEQGAAAFALNTELQYKQILKDCGAKDVADFQSRQMKKATQVREAALQGILNDVQTSRTMRYLYIPNKFLREINRKGPLFDIQKLRDARLEIQTLDPVAQRRNQIETDAVEGSGVAHKPLITDMASAVNQGGLVFVYLSDLIDTILRATDRRMAPTNFDAMLNKVLQNIRVERAKSAGGGQGGIDKEIVQEQKDLNAEEYEKYKRLRVVLGPIELVDPANPAHVKIVSLGDLPISIKYFIEFMTAQTLQKDRFKYPLHQFLQKLITQLLAQFLNDDSCFKALVKQRTTLQQTSMVGYNTIPDQKAGPGVEAIETDDLSRLLLESRASFIKLQGRRQDQYNYISRLYPDAFPAAAARKPLIKTAAATGKKFNYLVYSTTLGLPINQYVGNRAEDAKRGVHHYAVGRDRGIIQEIQLSRDSRPHLAEVRYAQEGFDGLKQLRETYSIDVSTFANFNMFPGQEIYVDPQGWVPYLDPALSAQMKGPHGLTDIGVGGYYMIMKAEHSFAPGIFTSGFSAKWVAESVSPDPPPAPAVAITARPTEGPGIKCSVRKPPQKAAAPQPEVTQNASIPSNARAQALAESQVPPHGTLTMDKQGIPQLSYKAPSAR